MPEDLDLASLSRMYPQLVDLHADEVTAAACAATDWTSAQPRSRLGTEHSLAVPEVREVPRVFLQLIVHETPAEVQAEICDALASQQSHQRHWQLAHVRRLRRLLEQQSEFEAHCNAISQAQRVEQEVCV